MGVEDRVQKLEEGQAFGERTAEELSAEVQELGRRVKELAAALARLEQRFNQEQGGDAESDEQ